MNYRKRIIDEALAFKLCAKGAVVIEGPKWCGKNHDCQTAGKKHPQNGCAPISTKKYRTLPLRPKLTTKW